jgi:hypothetical protein
MAGSGEEIVRRAHEVINRSESVDVAMTALEDLMHPEIEYVNPEDAIEGGTRKGLSGMRTALENFYEGAGGRATIELEQSTTAPRVSSERFSVYPIDSVRRRAASSVAERISTRAPRFANAVCVARVSASTVFPVRRAAAIVVMNLRARGLDLVRPQRAAQQALGEHRHVGARVCHPDPP